MSRIANKPVKFSSDIKVDLKPNHIQVSGSQGQLEMQLSDLVTVGIEGDAIKVGKIEGNTQSKAMAGTTRALINNMVVGVSKGFERRLILKGVGYRAKVQGDTLNLVLGFSHPVNYKLPKAIKATTPSNTEIVLQSCNKQLLGQVAAEIREFRKPEPYKGKGVRYSDERVSIKATKKK